MIPCKRVCSYLTTCRFIAHCADDVPSLCFVMFRKRQADATIGTCNENASNVAAHRVNMDGYGVRILTTTKNKNPAKKTLPLELSYILDVKNVGKTIHCT